MHSKGWDAAREIATSCATDETAGWNIVIRSPLVQCGDKGYLKHSPR